MALCSDCRTRITFFTETPERMRPEPTGTFVRTLTYVDPVELWYLKMQDLTVILQYVCFSNVLNNRWLLDEIFNAIEKNERHKLKIIITLLVSHKYRHQKIEVSYSKCSILKFPFPLLNVRAYTKLARHYHPDK